MSTTTTADGTQIYDKDWGSGQPVVFRHGWPLSADAWEDQMLFRGRHGYRCIAHDRRGHGRSRRSTRSARPSWPTARSSSRT
jgi:non-heme chloroperoxidase